jgi:hypothetical protein
VKARLHRRDRCHGRRDATDIHPQAPNTQTFLPACLLPTACDYNGLDCFDPLDDSAEIWGFGYGLTLGVFELEVFALKRSTS